MRNVHGSRGFFYLTSEKMKKLVIEIKINKVYHTFIN
jgi:hypothetical protein